MIRTLPDDGFRGAAVEPLVSVSITTYNHEKYIRQAVESVLMQETDFPFEVIIGDDCSTDGTRSVLLELQREHPDRVRLVFFERNLDGKGLQLFGRTLDATRGLYVATMDGDDYWTVPHKLREQVALLEAHPACSMCFHDVLEVAEDNRRPIRRINESTPPEFTGLVEILQSCYIGACSPMFRREVVCPLPEWYFSLRLGDWPLYVIAAERGPIGYIDKVMGVYRIHGRGMWNAMDKATQYERLLEFYDQLHAGTGRRLAALTRCAEAKWHYKVALAHNQSGRRSDARRSALRAVRLCRRNSEIDWVRMLKEFAYPYLATLKRWSRRHG